MLVVDLPRIKCQIKYDKTRTDRCDVNVKSQIRHMYGYIRRSTNTRCAHFYFTLWIYDDGFVAKHQTIDRYEARRRRKDRDKANRPHATYSTIVDAGFLHSQIKVQQETPMLNPKMKIACNICVWHKYKSSSSTWSLL